MQSVVTNLKTPDSLSFSADTTSWARLAYASAFILALAGIFTCWCDTPMIWDGAYQFSFSLIEQKPYFYLTRFHSYILWTPMVWLSHLTTNLTVLKMAYGLPFTLAPAFSVIASWWIVKKRAPWLILWAIFGAAAAPLPGQIFIINDSIFQQHMFWPVFLGLLVELDWKQMMALSLLVVFQFSHQIGLVLLSGGAGAAAILAIRDRKYRTSLLGKAAIAAILAVIALWKIIHFPDSYAEGQFTWEAAMNAWRWGVRGLPLWGLECMWGAGACILLARILRGTKWEEFCDGLWIVAALAVFAGGIIWTIWASDVHKWTTAANYRRWVVPLSVPFYFLAFLEQYLRVRPQAIAAPRRSPADAGSAIAFAKERKGEAPAWEGEAPAEQQPADFDELSRVAEPGGLPLVSNVIQNGRLGRSLALPNKRTFDRAVVPIGYIVSGIFALVISIQSLQWARMTRHLMANVEAYPQAIVPWSDISWTADTAFFHWGTASYVFVLEGRVPRHLVLDPYPQDSQHQLSMLAEDPPKIPLSSFTPISPAPGPAGWFDFRPMLARIESRRK